DPGPEGVGQHLRAGRRRTLVEVEPAHGHAQATHLHSDVGPPGELRHRPLPGGAHLVVATGVARIAQGATDVVEDDRRVGKAIRQLSDLAKLWMIEPGIEGESAPGKLGETLSPRFVPREPWRRVGSRIANTGIGVPTGLVADALEAAVARRDLRIEHRARFRA